jgi:pseudoazurin
MGSIVQAAEHEIRMVDRSEEGGLMSFEPSFLRVEPGDTVTFIPVNKGHNAETILGMIPEGAPAWKGEVNEAISVTLTEPGLYGIKCMPHWAMGMVALIQVGADRHNLGALYEVRLPGKAQARMMKLFTKVPSTP